MLSEHWLLLLHQLPPKPAYFRVKVWRRLQRLGAVPIRNAVYILPKSDQAQEDFLWVHREIVAEGGEAAVCEARFLEGTNDDQIRELFRRARDEDYAPLLHDARSLIEELPLEDAQPEALARVRTSLARLKRRLSEVAAIDFFGAPGKLACDTVVSELERKLALSPDESCPAPAFRRSDYQARTWITRKGVKIDRMASAWLIRRFIDRHARFEFVTAEGFVPVPGQVRFDMFEAEFTHQGDLCTFEVLVKQFGIQDPALDHLAQIVHDIDLKDQKFDRPESSGLGRLVLGITSAHAEDIDRLERGAMLFDDLYSSFQGSQDEALA